MIIFTLNKGAVAFITLAFYFWWIMLHMVSVTATFTNTASGQTAYNFFIRHVNINDLVNLYAHAIQSLGLRNGTWKTVQYKAVLTIIFR